MNAINNQVSSTSQYTQQPIESDMPPARPPGMLTKKQGSAIWAISKSLGLDDNSKADLIKSITDKTDANLLTFSEASLVITKLDSMKE